jgi:hypothetical protein
MDKIKMNRDKLIQKIEQIPALPIISRKIMEIAGDENASFKDLVEIIEKDQALALKNTKEQGPQSCGQHPGYPGGLGPSIGSTPFRFCPLHKPGEGRTCP